MSLKKFLKTNWWTKMFSRKGQTTLEYFILFTALAAVTIFASGSFLSRLSAITNQCLNVSVHHMSQDDLTTYSGTPPTDYTI